MIVKGAARSGPVQLANYLLRVIGPDKGDRAELLELQSGTDSLQETFLDWHTVGEATRGEKTLYHAQINPAAQYPMTLDQWKRAADILAEELGLADHPRAIVLHDDGKRPHIHVVWQRTDIETMKMWNDGENYRKHEQASLRMELEFGQDFVPGKHAKRKRERQPEFPREKTSHDEQQQAERTGVDADERKRQITALRAAADTAQAFKAALEDAGYVLAKGDRRGLVLVDAAGEVLSLSRHVKDLKPKEFKAFMAPIDPPTLPTVEQAKALQEEAVKKAQKQGQEASEITPLPSTAPALQPLPQPPDAALEALKTALAERQAKDAQKLADLHAHELQKLEREMDLLTNTKTVDFDTLQAQERDALTAAHSDRRPGLKGVVAAIQDRLSPRRAAEKAEKRRRDVDQLARRQVKERKDYLDLLERNRQLEIHNLKERQALQREDQQHKREEEQERYIREHAEAKRLLAELEEQRRREELEHNDTLRDGPPPPKLGK